MAEPLEGVAEGYPGEPAGDGAPEKADETPEGGGHSQEMKGGVKRMGVTFEVVSEEPS